MATYSRRAVLAGLGGIGASGCRWLRGSTLPRQLSDDEFRELGERLSEPPGAFTHSDNLVSNERAVAYLATAVAARGAPYIGVGPEQNFAYIAALRPPIAFIVDIRAENRSLHLLYKALFEIATDRADFLFRLFSRARPAAAGDDSAIDDLFASCEGAPGDPAVLERTLAAVHDRLVRVRRVALSEADRRWIEFALRAFMSDGPSIHYARSRPQDPPGPSFRTLMSATDIYGVRGGVLADAARFATVKSLHARNLLVPVVGDFGGRRALQGIAAYLREHRAVLGLFYASNVEVYLNNEKLAAFCSNLAALPADAGTVFIDAQRKRSLREKLAICEYRFPRSAG